MQQRSHVCARGQKRGRPVVRGNAQERKLVPTLHTSRPRTDGTQAFTPTTTAKASTTDGVMAWGAPYIPTTVGGSRSPRGAAVAASSLKRTKRTEPGQSLVT